MLDQLAIESAQTITRILELTGIVIIAVGALITLPLFLYRIANRHEPSQSVANLRSGLGRAILLGLEFLVAADIINTVAVEPSIRSVAVLGGIVVIRTFLSFSLETEINGRLPWQQATPRGKD